MVAGYEFHVSIPKFKMVNLRWQTKLGKIKDVNSKMADEILIKNNRLKSKFIYCQAKFELLFQVILLAMHKFGIKTLPLKLSHNSAC